MKKFLFDLEKEYRNLTDTRIALEIKHESLNNHSNINNIINNGVCNGNSSNSVNNNNSNLVQTPKAMSPIAPTSSYI